jgi:hypothetical protein
MNRLENTKEIVNFYQEGITKRLESAVERIKSEGFTVGTMTQLRSLEKYLNSLNVADHFFNSWHSESEEYQERHGA